jgi:hypothetical protein
MLFLASILAIFVYGMTAATLGTILPDLSERFGLTPSQNGQIAFAQASGLMIASLLVGPLLDNGGDKSGLLPGPHTFKSAAIRLQNSNSSGTDLGALESPPKAEKTRFQGEHPCLLRFVAWSPEKMPLAEQS